MAKNQKNQGFAAIRDVVSSSRFRESREYAAAVKEMAETLGKCNDLESEKINQGLEKLQV